MAIYRKPIAAIAVTAAVSMTLAACGGGSSSDDGAGGKASKGGTLYYLSTAGAEHLDPQRIYIGRDISNMSRLAYRSWTQFPVTTDADEAVKPQPDLATDTGTPSEDGKVWKFTVRDGVKWQDGKDITCEDFKYGFSRLFATDVITGGPSAYALDYLDLPADAKGEPVYKGPYSGKGQADYDKAVSCEGKTITYKFKKPWPDFNLATASLTFAAPFRKDQDQGEKSNYQVFSSGPYKLDGTWDSTKGGTFVRNDQWDPKTDDVRKAYPNKIIVQEGIETNTIYDRLIADSGNDKYAVTDRRLPPEYFSQIPDVKERYTNVESPYVDYLVPNQNRIKNPKVREALKVSFDRKAWILAMGGDKAGKPAKTLINPSLVGYKPNPNFDSPDAGDVDAAKKLLAESGEKLPYPIKYTYQQTPTMDKQAAAIKQTWEKAGFKVSLDPLADEYYSVIQKPNSTSDVMWAGWGADWPSISTVLPVLFDSRINLIGNTNNNDYGNYKSDEFNKKLDEAGAAGTLDEQAAKYIEADAILGKDVGYIPTQISVFNFLRGSKVTGYINGAATSTFPDLGGIGVAK